MMLNILDTNELIQKREEVTALYLNRKLSGPDDLLLEDEFRRVQTWKYSTGPIFDAPPYASEMAGFDGGSLLKKVYPSPYEARVKGAYSSGFRGDAHRLTILPSKSPTAPMSLVRFARIDNLVEIEYMRFFSHGTAQNNKKPVLVSLAHYYPLTQDVYAHIGIGTANSYSMALYYQGERKRITRASALSAPTNFQSEYEFHYNAIDELTSITVGGSVQWQRRR